MPTDETDRPRAAATDFERPLVESRPGPEAHLDEWVAPDVADERGFLRAGKILEWMDVVGVLAASRHCLRPAATASVDGLELRHPIGIHESRTINAAEGFTSPRRILRAGSMKHALANARSPPRSVL